jgi:DNA processing protein
VERPPAEIVAFASRGRAARARVASRAAATSRETRVPRDQPGRQSEQASEAQCFQAVLRAGPEACLARAERRPPGDLVAAWCDPLYPDQLRDLDDPPLCLFVRGGGDAATVRERISAIVDAALVAVVGTRAPSPYGEEMARILGGDLTRFGIIVVSGLAMGIDAVAQRAAADAGVALRPATVSVLGCGADVVYPRQNARLYARVAADGLIVSEFAWGVPARAWRFPARNRVMAALGRGVVLVEGAERSGARITAGFAVDLGREVLCVPGEAGRRLSAAPNLFLRDGARVCEGAADVLKAIAMDPSGDGAAGTGDPAAAAPALVLDHGGGAVRDVLHALGTAPLTVDELARRCGLPAAKAAAAVGELEVEGLARRVDGGRYRLLRA